MRRIGNIFCLFFYSVVRFLLEEAVNSAIHRCIEPKLMEPSVSTALNVLGTVYISFSFRPIFFLTFCGCWVFFFLVLLIDKLFD